MSCGLHCRPYHQIDESNPLGWLPGHHAIDLCSVVMYRIVLTCTTPFAGMAFFPPGPGMGMPMPMGYGQHAGPGPHLMHPWGPHPHAMEHHMGGGNPLAAFSQHPAHMAPPHMAHMLAAHGMHAGGYGGPHPGLEYGHPWGGGGMASAWYNGAAGSGSVAVGPDVGLGPGGRGMGPSGQARGRGRGPVGTGGRMPGRTGSSGASVPPDRMNGPSSVGMGPGVHLGRGPIRSGPPSNGPTPLLPASQDAGPGTSSMGTPYTPLAPPAAASLSVELSAAGSPMERRAILGAGSLGRWSVGHGCYLQHAMVSHRHCVMIP